MIPDFLLIGATKSGTTSLFDMLAKHPEVWLHPRKEVRFFTKEYNWDRGLAWYESEFEPARNSGARAIGEASNAYTRYPVYAGVPERISEVRPDMKLVYMIRDPMRRLESHYRHRLVTGIEWRNAEKAIRGDPRYVAASLYGQQIERYLRVFAPEQLFVARCEGLFADPSTVLNPLAEFLDLDPTRWSALKAKNVTSKRYVTPGPLRQFARFPKLRRYVTGIGNRLSASPARKWLISADNAVFHIGNKLRAELAAQFEKDAQKMARLPVRVFGHDPESM